MDGQGGGGTCVLLRLSMGASSQNYLINSFDFVLNKMNFQSQRGESVATVTRAVPRACVTASLRPSRVVSVHDWAARGTLLEMADAIGKGRDAVKRDYLDACALQCTTLWCIFLSKRLC